MTAHTPGPWEVKLTGYEGRSSAKYVVNNAKRRAVAHIKYSTVSPMLENARLIAAAPELLEALQDLIDTGFTGGPQGKRARAAIAKATGEQA